MEFESALELQSSLMEKVENTTLARMMETPPRAHGRARRLRLPSLSRTATVERSFVPGIALGVRPVSENDYKLAVRIQLQELWDSPAVDEISRQAQGEVDVRFIGRIRKRQGPSPTQERQRPLTIGASVAHRDIAAGTLGCFVRDGDGAVQILSNNHVLANENRAKDRDPVLQPGYWDGGREPADVVAHLGRFEPLELAGINSVDCALAVLADDVAYEPGALLGGDRLDPQPLTPTTEVRVEKIGRTTGRTTGQIISLNTIGLVVEYDSGNLRFDGQLEIEDLETPFSADGDSGALIYSADDKRPIGLLFGGDDAAGPDHKGVTYANPISEVLQSLQVDLLD